MTGILTSLFTRSHLIIFNFEWQCEKKIHSDSDVVTKMKTSYIRYNLIDHRYVRMPMSTATKIISK